MLPTIVIAPTEELFQEYLHTHVSKDPTRTYTLKPDDAHISIDQMRALADFVKTSGSISTLIISQLDVATEIAQHALLKLIEEKQTRMDIICWVHSIHTLLPTIVSRFVLVHSPKGALSPIDPAYQVFIADLLVSPIAQLLVDPLVIDMTKEKAEVFLRSFLAALQNPTDASTHSAHFIRVAIESWNLLTQVNASPQLIVDSCILRCKHGINTL